MRKREAGSGKREVALTREMTTKITKNTKNTKRK